ncbi:hypothetical protein Hanom_Chr14g01263561 [Helianthus anomalus]
MFLKMEFLKTSSFIIINCMFTIFVLFIYIYIIKELIYYILKCGPKPLSHLDYPSAAYSCMCFFWII